MSEGESSSQNAENKVRQLVWTLCIYLSIIYAIFGFLCYCAWRESNIFSIIGWSWEEPISSTFKQVIYAITAGGLGGTSYCFWNIFKYYCKENSFDPIWSIWYVFGPIHGSLLGVATYALVVGGLLVLGESVALRSNWAIFALSFLTGFSSKRVLRKIHAIAGQIFQ